MEKYKITLGDREMYFLYINEPHEANTWIRPVNYGYYKINFFIEVNAKIVIQEKQYSPKKYDFISYPLCTTHYGILHGRQNVEYFEFLIPERFFDVLDIYGKMTGILNKITSKNHFSLTPANQKVFVSRMYALREAARSKIHNLYILNAVLGLLFDIERFTENQYLSEQLSEKLTDIVKHMEKNAWNINSVNDICTHFDVSRAYLAKIFRSEIGCTPYHYLTDLKLEYSLSLLKEGKNVTEACFASGFNSCSVYIEAFKKKFFVTPHRYIKGINMK